jgi:glucose-6-phosphate 1-epimerase
MTASDRSNEQYLQQIIAQTNSVNLVNDKNGMCLAINNQKAQCLISLFGGHVLSFINKQDKRERLWLSKQAIFDGGTAIRGGIPICWPWFGPHLSNSAFPNHGYARTQLWHLVSVDETREISDDNNVTDSDIITNTNIVLSPNKLDDFDVKGLTLKLVIDCSESLTVSLITYNSGPHVQAISQALHTYFLIDDIEGTTIEGIDGKYIDKLNKDKIEDTPHPYSISSEVDRVHDCTQNISDSQAYDTPQRVYIMRDAIPHQVISQQGHNALVVWNPWHEKASTMKDMHTEDYRNMLCIEAANIEKIKPLQLEPNQIHKLTQVIY